MSLVGKKTFVMRNNNTGGTGFKQSDCMVGTFILLLNNVILYNSVANFIYQEYMLMPLQRRGPMWGHREH